MRMKDHNQSKYCRKNGSAGMRTVNARRKLFGILFLIVCAIAFFLSPLPRCIQQQMKDMGEQIAKGAVQRVVPSPPVDYREVVHRIPNR